MNIRENISELIQKPQFFDANNNPVGPSRLRHEYQLIKAYLLNNLTDDSTVALFLTKDYKYVLTFLACMEIGITYIPLKKEFPQKRIDQIKKLSSFELLIDDALLEGIFKENITTTTRAHFNLDPDKTLYIIFTSGSTGKPKGVMIDRKAYTNFIMWVDLYFSNICSHDKVLNTADFTFDLSMLDIALLISKRPKFFISAFNANIFKLAAEIERLKITTMATVPNNFNFLLSDDIYERADLSSLKFLLLGGARFSYGLYQKFQNKLKSVDVFNLYGPTEATVYCTAIHLLKGLYEHEVIDKAVSVGQDILNMQTVITDDDYNLLPANQKGEVYITGPQLMSKYLKNSEKTSEVLVNINDKIHYRTGDIGFKDDEGNLYVSGRMDDSIKTDGYRVNLSDIDSYIQTISYVDECATIAVQDEIRENILVLYIKVPLENQNKKELFADLHKLLPVYQIPKHIIFMNQFPLNNSGKISKKDLVEMYSKS